MRYLQFIRAYPFTFALNALAAAACVAAYSLGLLGAPDAGIALGAINLANLTPLAYGNGFTMWLYKTDDAAATVDTAGYFNTAAKVLRVGDVILRQTFTDTTWAAISTVGFHFVNANDGTTVDIADALAITATDTD